MNIFRRGRRKRKEKEEEEGKKYDSGKIKEIHVGKIGVEIIYLKKCKKDHEPKNRGCY